MSKGVKIVKGIKLNPVLFSYTTDNKTVSTV